jgi:hypothetical protein
LVSKVDFVFDKLVSLQEGVLEKTGSPEPKIGLRHIDTSDSNDVAGSALARQVASSTDFHEAGNVTDRHLIAGLLNLDVLVALESARANMHNEVALNIVCLAFFTRAFDQRIVLLLVNRLVNLKSALLTRIHGHLHEGLHVGRSRDDTAHSNEGADLLGANFSHLSDLLFAKLAGHNNQLVGAFEFFGDALVRVDLNSGLFVALVDGVLHVGL